MKLFWRVYLWLFLAAVAAFLAAGWQANRSMRKVYRDQVEMELLSQANWVASELQRTSRLPTAERVDAQCKEWGRLARQRVTVVFPDGRVMGDSDSNPEHMENHGNRPEIQAALAGKTGYSERFSDTLRRTLVYVAVPVEKQGKVAAVVRVSMPMADIQHTLDAAYREVGMGMAGAAVLFALVASVLVRRISRPLEDMRHAAERISQGDLRARVEVLTGGEEMRSLGRTLNQMAEQLGNRMETITQQSNELKAVFGSMSEGVLAVDVGGRVLNWNDAAAQLFRFSGGQARGQALEAVVRNPDLLKFVNGVQNTRQNSEMEIQLDGERTIRLHGTTLEDAAGKMMGVLVVMGDTTRLKRLEKMRQDFVSNVSHELKTPITALRGCVETLMDSDRNDREEDGRFIAMMGRQVDRLWAIVGDLLSLSRLEHEGQTGRILLESGPIREVLRRAAGNFSRAAEAKKVAVVVECSEGLVSHINAALLEQAVGNLIDNAIKYGAEGCRVEVSAECVQGKGIWIRVKDDGPGIEQRHLSRIFERFYRVDQARSRSLGGTGLGLAIVKHIAQAHGGSVGVESTPGKGSVFTIRLAARKCDEGTSQTGS